MAQGFTPGQTQAPLANDYAGDEVAAIVLDPGYSTIRAGFAGEDTPKSVVPTHYGVYEPSDSAGPELLFGENAIHNPKKGLEIRNPLNNEGIVEDADTTAKLWEYAITSRLTGSTGSARAIRDGEKNGEGDPDVDMDEAEDTAEKPLADSPLMMTEPGWNSPKAREKAIEIAIEEWGTPAFWLGRQGTLAAFSAGKSTALVVDLGASTTSVTPVYDGQMLKKGIMRSPLAGNFVSDQIRLLFAQSQPPVPLTPHYIVKSKTAVDAGTPAQAIYHEFGFEPSASFRRFEEERVLTEFKESVVQVWHGPGRFMGGPQGASNEEIAKGLQGRPFEMPDGWNQVFTAERFKAAEGLFDHKAAVTAPDQPPPRPDQTLPQLINASLQTTDADVRTQLLTNVVVVGGSSLLYGLTDRLNAELTQMYTGPRVRLQAPGSTIERKFASWLGGSILASLGSFHQMWVSRKEYEEHGPNIVEKRCR
ncbi:actin family [Lineolata rhizophorae]|uniref:Actin family n=1 Tax=Lineolata rhizophorae TaxID=578093 RepID=A0A6A6P677_9PEZI|nr:actin family [Lineolata rhizophorae]